VRQAKARGIDVTADVAIANLVGTDSDIESYDTAVKLLPPLRSKLDQEALWEGVLDGSIDMIVSDHDPMDHELKNCEWGSASFGAATIEQCFSWYCAMRSDRPALEAWVEAVAHRPRTLFGLGSVTVNIGSPADFTLFHVEGQLSGKSSLGVNVPTWPQQGCAIGTVLDEVASKA
jgi:dihydroorotase